MRKDQKKAPLTYLAISRFIWLVVTIINNCRRTYESTKIQLIE